MLGRNSLIVFCVGSLLSLAGQITRFVYRGDIVVDTVVVILGIAIMAFTAWLPEWREQVRVKSVGAAVAGVLIAALIAARSSARTHRPTAAAGTASPVPAPFSPECQGGSTEIVAEIAAAATSRPRCRSAGPIRILAIGSSAGRRQGGYTRQIERILKQVLKGADVVIINRGVSGELAANAAHAHQERGGDDQPRPRDLAGRHRRRARLRAAGGARATPCEKTMRWLKEHNVDVVLAGLQYVDRVSQDEHYYRRARAAARDRGQGDT